MGNGTIAGKFLYKYRTPDLCEHGTGPQDFWQAFATMQASMAKRGLNPLEVEQEIIKYDDGRIVVGLYPFDGKVMSMSLMLNGTEAEMFRSFLATANDSSCEVVGEEKRTENVT